MSDNVWCGEKLDQWPRVHSCRFDWCPEKRDDCERCDQLCAILRKAREENQRSAPTFTAYGPMDDTA